jgi:hypothetical protein
MKVGRSEGPKGQQKETNRPTADAGRVGDRQRSGLGACERRFRTCGRGWPGWIPGWVEGVIDEFCTVREKVQDGA